MDTIPKRFFARAKQFPALPAYHTRNPDGTWTPHNWGTYRDEVIAVASAMLSFGLKRGECVCILGKNRPEWVQFTMGAMCLGAVPAGIYTTNSPPEVAYIVDHAPARLLLIEDESQWDKVAKARADGLMAGLEAVIFMKGTSNDDPLTLTWEEFLARGTEAFAQEVPSRAQATLPEEMAVLIYTSGTTGRPKGVMLSHGNINWVADRMVEVSGVAPQDRLLSYLPLSHIAEQLFSVHGPVSSGHQVYYSRGFQDLLGDLTEMRPTWMFGVPRVWEKMYEGVSAKLAGAPPTRQKLANWAFSAGKKVTNHRNEGTEPGLLTKLHFAIADRLVLSKVRTALGLDAVIGGISGAAPISTDVLEFFAGLGVSIYEVYGQSEDCGPATINRPGVTRYGTVGPALPGSEVKIADDGEVLIRGPHVCMGYLHNPEATADTIIDGWLHTGDLGRLDDGFLTIIGRKKDIIITAGGKNIAPRPIEEALCRSPIVAQAVAIGDRRKYLSALLTLDEERAADLAATYGCSVGELHAHPKVIEQIQTWVDGQVNPQFARVEHIRKFTVLPQPLSIEAGELTATLKIKRNVVAKIHAGTIEGMYT